MASNLIERHACPVCESALSESLLDLPYGTDPIRGYLQSFYGGRFDVSLLDQDRYVVEKCRGCGVLFQRFVPSPELLNLLYGSVALADRREVAEERGLVVRQVYSFQVEQFIKYWHSDPTELRVLDFGAGTGIWLLMAEAYGCQIHAAELDAVEVGHLRAKGIPVYDVAQLPLAQFHYINAEQVFEHLVSPVAVMRQLGAALSPGGLIRVGVPDGRHVESLLADPDWSAPKSSPRSLNAVAPLEHINCYKRESLKSLGVMAGLEPFEYPARQFVTSMERARFIASAVAHIFRRPEGTSPIIFRKP
jgi:SAM-dependent methyltransferase